jgi:hypothetical protein
MKKILVTALIGAGCTSLGPMPATTGVSAVPVARPAGELQGAIAPVYRLSDAAADRSDADNDRNGRGAPQLLAVFEPDRLAKVPGLILGARTWGAGHDTLFEPLVGYRTRFGERFAGAILAYGTKASAEQNGASYDAKRFGAEVLVDARLVRLASWLAVHAQGSAQLTAIAASGTYCIDDQGIGIDCSEDSPNTQVDGDITGVYPAATAGLSIDVMRNRATGMFHGARIALLGALGRMPKLRAGRQQVGDTYMTAGLSITLGFGSDR